jgi:hypothetical protein
MKRYLLFAGDEYYPTGGWGDFISDFDTLEEAKKDLLSGRFDKDWYQIVDTQNKEVVDFFLKT